MKGNATKRAQAGGPMKGMPSKPKMSGGKGDGLKQAWSDQTAKPSKLSDMAAAKKKVR